MDSVQTRVKTSASAKTATGEVSKAGFYTLAGFSMVAGLWSVACLVGAFMNHGVVGAVQGWLTAVGMG